MKFVYIAIKGLKEIFRDRKGLAFLVAFPAIFMLVFGLAFSGGQGENKPYSIGVINRDEGTVITGPEGKEGRQNFGKELVTAVESLTFEGSDVSMFEIRQVDAEEGDKLLYSVYSSQDDMKPQLWSVNAKPGNIGANRRTLDVKTWADKCTFTNNQEAYCGVPKDLPKGSGMFEEMAENTSDQIYKIDVEKGDKQLMATPDKDINVSEIQVSEDGSTLFFTDSENKNVHKMKLGE